MNQEQIKWYNRFKYVSLTEGISFLVLLFLAMPLKYAFDMPMAVKVVGWAHGVLFMAYLYVLIPTALKLNWSWKRIFMAFVASVLPFGPFVFDRDLKKKYQISA